MLSYKLRKITSERNIDQKELAKAAGVSEGAVSQWMTGKTTPKMGRLQRIAMFLDVPLSYFVDENEEVSADAIQYAQPVKQEINFIVKQILENTDDTYKLQLLKNVLQGFLN